VNMSRWAGPIAAFVLLLSLAGCGGQDRPKLAQQTVSSYWNDLEHLRVDQAYKLLSSGVRSGVSATDFRSNIYGFLQGTAGISAKIGKPEVVGDCAQVPVTLFAPRDPSGPLHGYQHLYWLNGGWKITEQNGGVTPKYSKLTSCPTGA
jgi:hypothetical protein